MDSVYFEGFTGANLGNITFSNDIMLLIVLLLLSAFAMIFHLNEPLFDKMISNINVGRQRQSIFDATAKDSFFFNSFMVFQALLLCSIYIFSAIVEYKYIIKPDTAITLTTISALFVILLLFSFFKKAIYAIFGRIFTDRTITKILFTNQQALFSIWGISLYVPVLWILLVGKYFFAATALMIISYLLFRAILIYRFIYIFYNKNMGILFFSLYLCAQEIVPLFFLYEGLIYIYNIIEKNNIWQ